MPPTQRPLPHPRRSPRRHAKSVPGVFHGVALRSQLEIHFAKELEQRGIRWQYEPERLGAGGYLVDFYLPDLKCWVEVKGERDVRDNLLLPNVAIHVQRDRGERLLLYMAQEAFAVGPRGFKALTHEEFWSEVLHPPPVSPTEDLLNRRKAPCDSILSVTAKHPKMHRLTRPTRKGP